MTEADKARGASMKAVRYHAYGGSEVLVYEEADRPVAQAGQVVVRVAGTSYNDADAGLRAGFRHDVAPVTFPHIPNVDLAGVICEVGEGVSGWNAGDAVIAVLPVTAPGAAAEYVAAPAGILAPAPRIVDLADAAALPLVGLTAWQSLFEHADLRPGQSVLINGAGSAVGGYAVQLAVHAGAIVTATAGPRSRDRTRSYGAQRIIDYTRTPVVRAVDEERFDVVLNLAPSSPEENMALADLVADGGAFVSTTTPLTQDVGRGIRALRPFAYADAAQLTELAARVDAGELKIAVTERLSLSELPIVHARAAQRIAQVAELAAQAEGRELGFTVAARLRAEADTVDVRAVGGEIVGKVILTP
ncbi:NADP-dependent oxidoreductase [Nocardia cyriacigeorgica]|uniref:Alcohol dehydrogenase GroES domain protein n=1 Tax=Nocardia cyriacigeorgica (strain GUH-2) TaxID=1127134 RepID=H6QZ66_NOCCG|nr:NADP-dependent oxidoreductase [Nocardia cyriacigeorgica]CCF62820.1 Alcohol dehydrogenase GroES domain protein [Nocardia cyriacigeorgica GUH-2]